MSANRDSQRSWIASSAIVTALASLPLLIYFAYTTWLRPISPFYSNYDPEFQYLLNSLEVFKGRPYFYADHPGGPLEMVGTALYALTYPFLHTATGDFVEFHLTHPRLFLTLAHAFILLGSLFTVAYLAQGLSAVRKAGRPAWGATLALAYFAVHPMAFDSFVLWSHNSVSFAFGTLLFAILYKLLLGLPSGRPIPWLQLALLSFGAGLLAATTIYLAAWSVGILVIVAVWCVLQRVPMSATWKSLCAVVVGSLVGFGVGVLPLLNRMSVFFDWIGALLTHKSPYLLGTVDQPMLARWAGNLVDLARELPALFLAMLVLSGLVIAAIFRRRYRWPEDATAWAMTLGLLFTSLLLTLFILDHPKSDYMLAVAATVPVLAMTTWQLNARDPAIGRFLRPAFTILILGGVVLAVVSAMTRHAVKANMIETIEHQTGALQESYARHQGRDMQSLVVVWTYGTYSPCFSWWFGNDATDNAFRREIGQLCPRQLVLDIWSEMVIPRQGARRLDQTPWDMVIGCSDAFDIPTLSGLANRVSFPELRLSCGHLVVAYRAP